MLLRVEVYFILFLIKTYANYSVSFHEILFFTTKSPLKNIHPCVESRVDGKRTHFFLKQPCIKKKIYLSLGSMKKKKLIKRIIHAETRCFKSVYKYSEGYFKYCLIFHKYRSRRKTFWKSGVLFNWIDRSSNCRIIILLKLDLQF